MKKTIISIILILSIILSLSSCADSSDKSSAYDLTIASCGSSAYTAELYYVLEEFEKEYGWKIEILNFDIESDAYALQTKVLAKDKDIDIVYSPTLNLPQLIKDKYYVDLGKYDSLRSKIESNAFTKHVCCYNGDYFGIAIYPRVITASEQLASLTNFKYIFSNLDLVEGKYDDPNGEELFNILKHYYEYKDPATEPQYYSEEFPYISSEYLIINPYSKNKDNAALFLEKCFDYLNGDKTYSDRSGNVISAGQPYPNGDDYSNMYLLNMYATYDITSIIGDAINAAKESDGSDEALRKLAKDAAKEVRKRLEG